MKKPLLLFFGIIFLCSNTIIAQDFKIDNNWGAEGLSVISEKKSTLRLNFSVTSFQIKEKSVKGEKFDEVLLPYAFLPNQEGAPNLPGKSEYIAIPNNAIAKLEIIRLRKKIIEDIDVLPAPNIPLDNDNQSVRYQKDKTIYSENALYPDQPFKLSEQTQIRGIEAVMLGITPYQYNPVTKQLTIYTDIEFEISFSEGAESYGDNRLRSRWWDPIINDLFINKNSIPQVDYNKSYQDKKLTGCEYLIITPNDSIFLAWADTIKQFRNKQGINTNVFSLDDIGGISTSDIEDFIDDAYATWDVVPAACLLLGDYGANDSNRILAPIFDDYCVSDNIYADVSGNHVPDIIFARMTARNNEQLETMVTKFINYETNPPTNPDFYDKPITALGWQTERWFQICSESIGGFWSNVLGKNPVRINNVYEGNPNNDPWSTAGNTSTVLNVFGPDGLGYIPSSPGELGNWSNGSSNMVSNAINDGAFMLQHRDHGYIDGWGEPSYASGNISSLTNTDLTYVFSINCQTGMYASSSNCFAENFHRYKYDGQNAGALGILAATENSYSFVNDAYVWGIYDYLWPEFLPDDDSDPVHRGILPAFGSAAGKYFLAQTSWPNMSNYYTYVTNNLFHHHGDAFLNVYTEVPENLAISFDPKLLDNMDSFKIWTEENALVALTVDDVIIASMICSEGLNEIIIPIQSSGTHILVTVTKQNYFRYENYIEVIDSDVPYVMLDAYEVNDNNNGLIDYNETASFDLVISNHGLLGTDNLTLQLESSNPFIAITNNEVLTESIESGNSITIEDAFSFDVDLLVPDNENISFELTCSDGDNSWLSQIILKSHAPVIVMDGYQIDDSGENNNGRIDPGETINLSIPLYNIGSSEAINVSAVLSCENSFVSITTSMLDYGNISEEIAEESTFIISIDDQIAEGLNLVLMLDIYLNGMNISTDSIEVVVGRYKALVLDLDPGNYSGPVIMETLENLNVTAQYSTSFPEDYESYSNIFMCLGVHSSSYELSNFRGQELKEYLLNGGNVYLEGAVSWKNNVQTPLHDMFNIGIENNGIYIYDDIIGTEDYFTSNLQFDDYEGIIGANNYELVAEDQAHVIFTSQEPYYGMAVANKSDNYRTIGTIFEFGQLADNIYPSTKEVLMQKYLNWFDGLLITETDEPISNKYCNNHIKYWPNPFSESLNLSVLIPEECEVLIQVHNIQGEFVTNLYNSQVQKNEEITINWNGTNNKGLKLPPGVYFIKLSSNQYSEIVKVIIR